METPRLRTYSWLLTVTSAPEMENLDWEDPMQISYAKGFFEKYVTSWNPRSDHTINLHMH